MTPTTPLAVEQVDRDAAALIFDHYAPNYAALARKGSPHVDRLVVVQTLARHRLNTRPSPPSDVAEIVERLRKPLEIEYAIPLPVHEVLQRAADERGEAADLIEALTQSPRTLPGYVAVPVDAKALPEDWNFWLRDAASILRMNGTTTHGDVVAAVHEALSAAPSSSGASEPAPLSEDDAAEEAMLEDARELAELRDWHAYSLAYWKTAVDRENALIASAKTEDEQAPHCHLRSEYQRFYDFHVSALQAAPNHLSNVSQSIINRSVEMIREAEALHPAQPGSDATQGEGR